MHARAAVAAARIRPKLWCRRTLLALVEAARRGRRFGLAGSQLCGEYQALDRAAHGPATGQERSIASHMALVHLRVMPSGDVLARILGIAAKDVVTLDLLGPEELYGLVVL